METLNAEPSLLLKRADSLFALNKKNAAIVLYQEAFNQGYVHPKGLLRLGSYHEDSGLLPLAFYYYSLEYQLSDDLSTLRHLEQLSERQGVSGYTITDIDFLLSLYQKSRYGIFAGLIALAFLMIWQLYRLKKRGERLSYRLLGLFAVLTLILWLNNFVPVPPRVILLEPVYIMDSPSAGGNCVAILPPGNRLLTLSEQNHWVQVLWERERRWIRDTDLLRIQ